jgi:TraB/PrgY/gumN family
MRVSRRALAAVAQSSSSTNSQQLSASRHQTLTLLRNPRTQADVWLIGTAHVSAASAHEVRDAIRLLKPQTVVVELDAARAARLRRIGEKQLMEPEANIADFSKALTPSGGMGSDPSGMPGMPDLGPLAPMMRGLGMPGGDPVAGLMQAMASFTKQRGGSGSGGSGSDGSGSGGDALHDTLRKFYSAFQAMGIIPGLEFKMAMEEAKALDARVVYGDREMKDTLERVWQGVDIKDLMSLAMGRAQGAVSPRLEEINRSTKSFEEMVEALKDRETVLELTTCVVLLFFFRFSFSSFFSFASASGTDSYL